VYTLALTNPKWVRVYANEKDLSSIKMGAKAQVIRDTVPDQPIIGQIGYISSVAEFTLKRYKLKIYVPHWFMRFVFMLMIRMISLKWGSL
jgi:hypothetical protein